MREMKESNISWVGKIPCSWKVEKNKHCFQLEKNIVGENKDKFELLSLTKKGIIKKDESSTGGKVPESFETYQSVKKDQLVMCLFDLDVSAVFSGLSNYDGMISPAYKVYNCNKIIDKNYAKYWFECCFDGRKYKAYSKSLRYVVNTEDFGPIEILLPPKEEQEKIAKLLDNKIYEIDNVIEKTKETIEDYKRLKDSIVLNAVTRGVNSSETLKESGNVWIRKIPNNWTMLKMNKICKIVTDYVASGSFASLAENVKYIDTPDYARLIRTMDISGKYENIQPVYINEHAYNFLSNSNLFGGEIILPNIGASVGDVYIVPNLYKKMSLAPNSIMIKTRFVDKYYYYCFLCNVGRQSLISISGSTAQPKFNKTDFKMLKFPVPPMNEQEEIVKYLDKKCIEIDSLIISKEKIIEELEQYKKSLIYEYVTGKKEVV